mmetsp:Transcript_30869/g.99211  ORF Transcript_30869/g.99211 Transcript_30869/m.99211 type:complete len:108 (+) Transcript_30869:227-550(+)
MRGYHRDATTSPLSRKQTGSYEVIPESVQYLYRLYSKEVVHLTKELCLKEEKLTSIPLVMRNFKHLHKLDLSYNLLTSLPVRACFTSYAALPVYCVRLTLLCSGQDS